MTKFLWVFHATNKEKQGVFHYSYAYNEIEARQQESAWMAARVNEGFGDIKVWHSPSGFTPGTSTDLPGSIDTSEASHASEE